MSTEAVPQQDHRQGLAMSPNEEKPSSEMSSTTGPPQQEVPYEKTAEAEAGLQQQKPPGGPPGGPPPNGGLTAWLQVLGGFFLFFNTWVCVLLVLLMFGSGYHCWCCLCNEE